MFQSGSTILYYHQQYMTDPCLPCPQQLGIVSLKSHSHRRAVVFQDFNLHFPQRWSVCSILRQFLKIVLFVFFLLQNAENYLCILDTSPMSGTWFANIFVQSAACVFIFLMVSFAEWKFLILMMFNLLIFSLMNYVLGAMLKNTLPNYRSQKFSPIFSSN